MYKYKTNNDGHKYVYICLKDDCMKPFLQKDYLQQHRNRYTHDVLTKIRMECPLKCGYFLESYISLRSHLKDIHSIEDVYDKYSIKKDDYMIYDILKLQEHKQIRN